MATTIVATPTGLSQRSTPGSPAVRRWLASKASSSSPIPSSVAKVLPLPQPRAGMTTSALAASWRTPWTTSSRISSRAAIQVDSSETSTMAISTPATSTLSAVRSMKTPSGLTSPRARADRPSTKSVSAAAAKTTKASRPAPGNGYSSSAITTGVAAIRATPSMFGSDVSRAGRAARADGGRRLAAALLGAQPRPFELAASRSPIRRSVPSRSRRRLSPCEPMISSPVASA